MGQEKFSFLDQFAPKPGVPAPKNEPPYIPPGVKPPAEKKEKFSFLDEFAPGAAAAAVPGVLPPYPKKEPSFGLPYIIKETVRGAIGDIGGLKPPSTFKPAAGVDVSGIQKVMNILYSGGRAFVHTAARDPLQFFLNSVIKGASTTPGLTGALAGVAAAAKPQLPAFPEAARVTPLQDVAAGAGSLAGFIVGAPGKIGALTHGPIFATVAKALGGKVSEKAAGIVAHLLAGSANLGVASVVAHPEVEGAFQRFGSGAVLGGIFGGTNLANFEKAAPFLNTMIRQVGSRAAAAVAGQYKPEFFNKIVSGDITPEIAQDVFDELLFTWFSRPGVSAEGLKNDVLRIKDEARRANLKVYLGPEAEEALRWFVPIRETMSGLGKMAQSAGVGPAELLKPENLGLLQQFLGVPDRAALDMRLAQMAPTSARAPEQVETFAELPREIVPAGEVKPTPPKPAPPAAAPAAPAARGEGEYRVRVDQVLRDTITRVEKGEGSPEDIAALTSAAKRSERLKTLTEGYRGRLQTDLLTGVGSDRALAKVKDHAERRQYWMDLKGVKEGNNDPERGYRWTDENIFKPTGDVLKTSGADAYRRGGGSDEFIILSKPGESAESFQGRISDIERQLGEKNVEFRGVMAETVGEAERFMAQKKKGEPGGGVPPAAPAPAEPAGPPAAPIVSGEKTPAQEKGLKFPKPFKNHGFMTFNNINGKAWERARELVKDGWVIEYDHNGGKDGIARIVDKRDPGDGDYYRAESAPLRKYYETATSEFKGRETRFGERVAARPLVSLIKSRGGISWEKIKESGLAGEFEAILEGPNKDVVTKRKGKGLSPYEAAELAKEHGRTDSEDIQPLIDELLGSGRGKPTSGEAEARLAGEQKATERELDVVKQDLAALKSGKKKWDDLHDPQQEDLVAMFGEAELETVAPKDQVREIMKRLEEEFEAERPSKEEEPEWFTEVEKAEEELKTEAGRVIGELKSGRKKWEDLTGNEQDDVVDIYGAEAQEKYRRQIREPGDISDIEEAIVRGRKLTKAQEKRAREAGILEELPEKAEPPEPEIPKTPEEVLMKKRETPTATMQLVNLAVRTPADTVFAFNNVPAKDLQKIRDYAKKLGVEDKLIVGDEHAGTWGEAYSPAEHLAHVREILRDVKKQPKSVWQSWERHVKIDTSGLKPDDGPPVGLSVQAISGPPAEPSAKKNYFMSPASRAYQNTIDKLHSLRKLGDFLRKDKIEFFPENDPYIGARLYAGVQGKAEVWLFKKRFKMRAGNVVYNGESLSDILKPVRGAIEDFSRYLVYRRVPELAARGIETGIDVARAKAFVHQNLPRFEGQAKKFTEYHDALLDVLVESGRISKEKADIIKTLNPNYAAFQRVMEDIVNYGYLPTSSKFLAKIPNPIKEIHGSEKPVVDPILSAIKATYVIQTVSERARINRQVIELRDLHPEIAKLIKPTRPAMELVATLEDGTKVFRPKKNQPEGIIESWKDGERHYYEVPLDLYQTMSLMDNTSMSWMVKALAIPARILRTGATTTPEFAFRNPFKDQWSGFVNARYGLFPGIDFVRGLFHMVGKDDLYQSWKAGGGDWSMVTALDRATSKKKIQEVLGRRDYLLWLKSPIKFLERLSMYGEMPTRIGAFARAKGAFDKAKGRGVTDVEAAYEAREATVDFARRGAKMKEISAIYTFFNARLQGIDRTARAFRERPMTTMARVFAVATLPSIINYLINRDDPQYQEIPRWQRNLFWMPFKINGIFVRIPKGDIGVLFGTPAEMILEQLDQDPRHRPAIDKFAVDLFKETLPISDWGGLFPVALRPLFENYVNFNFFKKRTIVPMGMERLEPEFQSFPYTTESAKALGQVLHYPPAKIENFIRGYGGGLGTHALKILDTALTKAKQIPERPEKPKEPADIPGIGAFFVRHPEGFGSESAQKFYDVMKKIDQVKQTEAMLYKEKRKTELDAYRAKNPVEMKAIAGGYYSAFVKVRNELSEIRKAQDRIYEDPKIDVNRKRMGLELLDRKIMILLVPLLNRYAALGEKYGK